MREKRSFRRRANNITNVTDYVCVAFLFFLVLLVSKEKAVE